MSRNATASWSGYAHQGKIGLLVAIKKIKSLHGTLVDLSTYRLSYETREDVALFQNGTAIEVHQVKAYTSGTTIGSYTGALMAFESCTGVNYLHSICEITNWADLTAAQNPNGVLRYPYSDVQNFCSLDDLEDMIDYELHTLLNMVDHQQRNNEMWRREVFNDYLGALDEKIRIEHATKPQAQYDITFTLLEVSNIILERSARSTGILGTIRRKMFEAYLEFIDDLDNENIHITDEKEGLILNSIKYIYALPPNEFEQFLRDINPHTTQGIIFNQCVTTDDYFSKENFQAVFLACLKEVENCIFLHPTSRPPHYFKAKHYLLTSINSPDVQLAKSARRILLNDRVNFSSYETDFIINENHTGELGKIASVLNNHDPNKFFARKQMTFITKADAITNLNL